MNKVIEFTNARQINRENPRGFILPRAIELDSLGPHDNVQVCAFGERFWVKIYSVEGDTVKGFVNNDLITDQLHFLDEVEFRKENIYKVQ